MSQTPTSAGEVLTQILSARGQDIREAAYRCGLHPVTLSAIVRGSTRIGPVEAVALERLTERPASYWLKLDQGAT